MHLTLTDKLRREVDRYRNKEFLKAVLAVCAIAARANPTISLEARFRIDRILDRVDLVELFDRDKVTRILNDYIHWLTADRVLAGAVLHAKVARMAGDRKKARTLLRVAYLVMSAGEMMTAGEHAELDRLCRLLALDPATVTGTLRPAAYSLPP